MADKLDVNLDVTSGQAKDFGGRRSIHDREEGEAPGSRAGD